MGLEAGLQGANKGELKFSSKTQEQTLLICNSSLAVFELKNYTFIKTENVINQVSL